MANEEQTTPRAAFRTRFTRLEQRDQFTSGWSRSVRLRMAAWSIVQTLLFRPTPKFLNGWRRLLLQCFGASIHPTAFIASSARVRMPWNLVMKERACIGEEVDVYNLGRITLGRRCTVAQQSYLCAGTHDLDSPKLELMTAPIVIGDDAFLGARAMVLPGVRIGSGAVVGAGSVVARDIGREVVAAGNPTRVIGRRMRKASNH